MAGKNSPQNKYTASAVYFQSALFKAYFTFAFLGEVRYIVVSPKTGSMMPMLRPDRDQAAFYAQDRYRKGDMVNTGNPSLTADISPMEI
jgi:hypothetical protein